MKKYPSKINRMETKNDSPIYRNENLSILKKMLDADDWHAWLLEAYSSKYRKFKPFLLEREQEFIDMLPDVIEHLTPPQSRQIKHQTGKMLRAIGGQDWDDLSKHLELFLIGKIVYKNDINNLIQTSRDSLINKTPTIYDLKNYHIIEIDHYLKLLCEWIFEYKQAIATKEINDDSDEPLTNDLRNKLFDSEGILNSFYFDVNNEDLARLSIYNYIIKLLLDSSEWLGTVALFLDELKEKKHLGQLTIPELFRILKLFNEENLISKSQFKKGVTKLLKSNIRKEKYLTDFENYLDNYKRFTKILKSFEPSPPPSPIVVTGENKEDRTILQNSSFRKIPDIKLDILYNVTKDGKKIQVKKEEAFYEYRN